MIFRETEIEHELNEENRCLTAYFNEPVNRESYHEIIIGDITSKQVHDYLRKKGPKLVVTSPPYNAGIHYDNYDDAKTLDGYLETVIEPFISLCNDIATDGGRIAIN